MHRLVTIPVSHYVERARWGLDLAGLQYTEEKYPPLLHYVGLARAGCYRAKTVPQLLTPAGQQISDSGDILRYVAENFLKAASLYPNHPVQLQEVKRLEDIFSNRLGVDGRVVCYWYLFNSPAGNAPFLAALADTPGISGWARSTVTLLCRPIKALMARGMGINRKSAAKCTNRVRSVFAEVDALLADGRPFLVAGTTSPTAADITFAALSAILVAPPQHYAGDSGAKLPDLALMPPDFPAQELRATRAGQHVLKMYAQHRMCGRLAPAARHGAVEPTAA